MIKGKYNCEKCEEWWGSADRTYLKDVLKEIEVELYCPSCSKERVEAQYASSIVEGEWRRSRVRD